MSDQQTGGDHANNAVAHSSPPPSVPFTGDVASGSVADWAARVLAEINKVYIGQDRLVRGVLTALLAEGHVLIESVPGLGKTPGSGPGASAGLRVQSDPVHA
jgi:MoxR-like ATPase